MFTHNEKSTNVATFLTMDIENFTQNKKSANDATVLTMEVNNFTKDETSTDDNMIVNVSFMAIFSLLIFVGIVGNSLTIVIIKRQKGFHTGTYITIALLAFVDLVAIWLRTVVLVAYFYGTKWHTLPFTIDALHGVLIATFITFLCSCIHVVILARLRYKLLAFPMEAMTISHKTLIRQSIIAWSVSCIFGIPYGLMMFLVDEYHGNIIEIILSALLCVCTVLPIVIFHILKTRKIREGITQRTNTIRSMNKMMIAISVVQIVSTTSIASTLIIDFITKHRTIYYYLIVHLVLLISHVMNPILFFYFTYCRRVVHPTGSNRNNMTIHTDRYISTHMWIYGEINLFYFLEDKWFHIFFTDAQDWEWS